MSQNIRIKSVTKCAKRKVNLVGISSEYDNIEWGTFLTAEIAYENDEDLVKGMSELSSMARAQVEKDIRDNMIILKKMAEDDKNKCLLGMGDSIRFTEEEAKSILSGEGTLPLNSPLLNDDGVVEIEEEDIEEVMDEEPVRKTSTKKITKKKEETKENIKENIEESSTPDVEDGLDINDLLGLSSYDDSDGDETKEPAPSEKEEIEDLEDSDDLGDGLDFLEGSKEEIKKVEKEESKSKDDKDEVSDISFDGDDDDFESKYEEEDLEDFNFEDAAGDLFN